MAWIESHQELENHPKVFDLMNLMEWDINQTIGRLHRFWWWCLKYAQNGDLRKHNNSRLAASCGVPTDAAERFVKSMIIAGWIDEKPFLRVHDWWDYAGRFLQGKYSKSPSEWKAIRKPYGYHKETIRNPTLPTNHTIPNQPNLPTTEKTSFKKPTPEEATAYGASLGFVLDGEQFVNYYEARGWAIKGAKIKSWQACIRTWKKNNINAEKNKSTISGMAGMVKEVV